LVQPRPPEKPDTPNEASGILEIRTLQTMEAR
jgi:hypothetical protein